MKKEEIYRVHTYTQQLSLPLMTNYREAK